MKILSWYIAKTFVKYWAISLLALMLLVVVANLFGNLDNIFTSRAKLLAFAEETFRSLPIMLDILLPMTVLLATLFTFNTLARSSELVAMKSVGVGLRAQLQPIFLVLIFIAALDYFNQNYLYRMLQGAQISAGEAASTDQWRTLRDRIIYLADINSERRSISNVRIFQWAARPFRLLSVEHVDQISYPDSRHWVFEDVVRRDRSGEGWRLQHLPRVQRAPQEFPDVFQQDALDAHYIPFFRLYGKIRQLASQGQRLELYELEWYQKTAAVCAPFVLVWFGTPLSQIYFRRGRASGEIMLGILGGLLFMIATEIAFTLGKGGFLHPLIAAWAVNTFYVALGCALLWRLR